MRLPRLIAALLLCLPLAGCISCHWTAGPFATQEKKTANKTPAIYLEKTDIASLPGWTQDASENAIPALLKSCKRFLKKKPEVSVGPLPYAGAYADWQPVCESLRDMTPGNGLAARQFMKDNFTPYAVYGDDGSQGLFTGYYEPLLHGAAEKRAPYLTPLYARPTDLVTVHLGDFKPSLKGETIMGRVADENLVPYYTRAQIEKGALKDRGREIVWVDNPVDAFFLHIQGSGLVQMEDGSVLRVGYAAQNGHAYTAIGRALIKQGALTKENVSMQSIRDWLEAHPEDAPKVMDINQSFVFFRKLPGDGPLGAEGVELTPRRSMAVDRHLIPYGVPVWLDAQAPQGNAQEGARLQRLMIAQDTGGAITGAVRGDFFWGAGDDATAKAGAMKSAGRYYIFLPKSVTVPEKYLKPAHHSFLAAAMKAFNP
ncbi:MAG: murein transglycosylase [Alphaproteobacteria bacterium]|nr:murein transglycosylase [Alphaproteobacteria bacterium]